MFNVFKFLTGLKIQPKAGTAQTDSAGEMEVLSSNNKLLYHNGTTSSPVVTEAHAATLTSKVIDADDNTISDLETDNLKAGVLNTSTSLAGATDAQVPSALATKTYADSGDATGTAALQAHLDDAADAHDASAISNIPAGTIAATDIQAAVNELDGDIQAHITDSVDAHDASAISVAPAGNLASIEVQAALVEHQSEIDSLVTLSGVASGSNDFGTFTGTTIPDASTAKASLQSLETAHEAHVADATAAHAASAVSNTPSGNLAATEVQAALNELQTDVDTRATSSALTAHTGASTGVHGVTGAVVGTTDTQVLTNKDFDGGTASNTSRFTIPKASKATLDGLTRKEATFVFASDEDTVYVDDGTNLIPVGSGGGGLDTFFTEDFSVTTVSTFASGNNATFLGGGALAGTLANETASPIAGTRSAKYTQAAGSLNDYFALAAITPDLKQRGNTVGFRLAYKYDGATNDIKFVAYDVTNSLVLSSSLTLIASASNPTFLVGSFVIPASCTSLRIGFQVVVANNGKILTFDDVELSTNPFLYKDLVDTQYLYKRVTATASLTASAGGSPVRWSTITNTGTALFSYDDSNGRFTALKSGTATASFQWRNNVSAFTLSILKNGVVEGIDSQTTAGNDGSISMPFTVVAGDYIQFQSSQALTDGEIGAFTINAESFSENIVTSQTSDDSYVRVYTANGYGSTNTKIRRFTTTADSSGSAITYADSATNGGSFTINTDGVYNITYTDRFTAIGTIGISKNSAALTTDIFSITEATKLAQETVGGANQSSSCSWTGHLSVGDVIRAHTDGGTAASDATIFSITKIGTKSLSAAPVQQVVTLTDVKTSGTSGGTGTAGSYITRTLNTVEGDSGIVSLSSNQFTLYPGKYVIDFQCPMYQTNRSKARLQNITDSTTTCLSQGAYSDAGAALSNNMRGMCVITLTATKVFEIQHRVQTSTGASDFGITMGFGDSEIFTRVEIRKLK